MTFFLRAGNTFASIIRTGISLLGLLVGLSVIGLSTIAQAPIPANLPDRNLELRQIQERERALHPHHIWNSIRKITPASLIGIDLPAWPAASKAQSGLWAGLSELCEALANHAAEYSSRSIS